MTFHRRRRGEDLVGRHRRRPQLLAPGIDADQVEPAVERGERGWDIAGPANFPCNRSCAPGYQHISHIRASADLPGWHEPSSGCRRAPDIPVLVHTRDPIVALACRSAPAWF